MKFKTINKKLLWGLFRYNIVITELSSRIQRVKTLTQEFDVIGSSFERVVELYENK